MMIILLLWIKKYYKKELYLKIISDLC